jgi:hypothetical protein
MEQSLYNRTLGAKVWFACWKSKVTYQNYRLIAEWLSCLQYINPDDRLLLPYLERSMLAHYHSFPDKHVIPLYSAYWSLMSVPTNLDLIQQALLNARILSWTQDCNNSHIPLS